MTDNSHTPHHLNWYNLLHMNIAPPKSRSEFLFHQALSYLYPVAIIAAATGVLFLFRDTLNPSIVALLYLLPVLFSTTRWGLGPGILAGVLTFLCYNFFFLEPYYTLQVHKSQDLIALIIFFIVAVVVNQLVGRAKTSLEAALAREQESTRLYELSVGLSGINQFSEIAEIIAEKTHQTFAATVVKVVVEKIYGEEGCSIIVGETRAAEQLEPAAVVRLETARGALGEIRLWREQPVLLPNEMRLLQTFAAQGALALERAALAHAETRAQVSEESDRLKSALLSSVSHEFRTPLVTIKAATTSLLSEQVAWDSDARRDLLTAVDEEADHLNHLVGNLLNMSRIEAGGLKPDRRWNVLAEIVDVVIKRMYRPLASYRLVVEIPDDLPLVPVDYMQIEQVFTNLISNSTKYAPPESEISIRARVFDAEWILVHLTNQSPVMAPEHLDRIFDKFYRVTNADKVTGTGLGLSISKGIIEAHGGRIWAENRPEGFTFNFTLPRTIEGKQPTLVEPEGE
jgi:two-component system sensor histidine kinase KdpD